jgi:hypothetical protein
VGRSTRRSSGRLPPGDRRFIKIKHWNPDHVPMGTCREAKDTGEHCFYPIEWAQGRAAGQNGQRCSSPGAKSQFVVKIAQTAFFD